MDADGGNVRNLTAFAGDDRFPAWTPDAQSVVWTRFAETTMSFDLYSMPVQGGVAKVVVATPFNELAPSISPDGNFVVYQTDRAPPFGLYVAPLSGSHAGRPVQTTGTVQGSADLTPFWGPN